MLNRHVFEDQRRADGSRCYNAAYLNEDDLVVIEIHDRGPVVERMFGKSEFESLETFNVDQTAQLRKCLGDDVIAAIAERFSDSLRFADYCQSVGVGPGKVWNRIGD